jgi:hypothetical protein
MRAVVLGVLLALSACGSQFGAGGAAGAGGSASGSGSTVGGSPQGGTAQSGGVSGRGGSSGNSGTVSSAGGGAVPPPIPTNGLSVWLTADRGVVESGGVLQRWLDQSGRGMDTIQTGSNFSPKLVTNGGFGALQTLEFDGVDDYLSFQTSGFADFSQGLSWFIVLKPASPNCASIMEVSNGSEVQDISLGYYQKSWQYEAANDFIPGGSENPEPSLLATIHRPDETVELRMNGTIIAQSNFGLPEKVVRTQDFVGKTLYGNCDTFQGNIAEILLYSRAVSDLELLQIEGYLRAHWACCQ